jgi:Leucine-rich repeat (LRR) protein
VSDVSVISECTLLEVLDLSCTQVADLSPLAGSTALEAVNLAYTRVTDVSPLSQARLVFLDISNTEVTPGSIAVLDASRLSVVSGG